jgi:hypothetical protein
MKPMKVKILASPNAVKMLEYYNNRFCNIDGYEFIYTNDLTDCDVCVVFAEGGYNSMRLETNAPKRICFTGEPSVIYRYSADFLRQFTDVVTSQCEAIGYGGFSLHMYCQSFPNMVGFNVEDKSFHDKEVELTFNNDEKPKMISAICSGKTITPQHRKRIEFLSRLKNDVPELDLYGDAFGRGIPFKDLALREYKYTVAIENVSIPDYWTEKLSDPIFSLTQPIYCGCTNIERYFDGICTIDIGNYDEALSRIRGVLRCGYDIDAMRDRRSKLLSKYSLHSVIVDVLEGRL